MGMTFYTWIRLPTSEAEIYHFRGIPYLLHITNWADENQAKTMAFPVQKVTGQLPYAEGVS
jgi:hypothetical protein